MSRFVTLSRIQFTKSVVTVIVIKNLHVIGHKIMIELELELERSRTSFFSI